ncbi:MAG TPA: sulfate adenylyltransferase, partial [Candidatus Aerophobetes bacterium]|nr:sulfate adenylyltransferase [Candidatus Aerophobetes bacterium]
MNFAGHGGKEIVERVVFSQAEAKEKIEGLEEIEVTGRCARECINICYGFFTPLEGFMRKEDVISVCEKMTL